MKPEQQRSKIAEACGRCPHPKEAIKSEEWEDGNDAGTDWTCTLCGKDPHYPPTPDYLNDLNAMHEAEKMRGWHEPDNREANVYLTRLRHITGLAVHPLFFTAPQRAEAFLRTLNLWTS